MACSTTQDSYTAEQIHAPLHEAPRVTLVKRTQTQEEIDALYARFHSLDARQMPRGVHALLSNLVQVPATEPDDGTPQAAMKETNWRPGGTIESEPLSGTNKKRPSLSTIKTARLSAGKEEGKRSNDEYLFAKKKPQLPLSGGYLNNRSFSVDAKKESANDKIARAKEDSLIDESSRGRLRSEPSLIDPIKEGLASAKSATSSLIDSASGALDNASKAVSKGIENIKKQVEPDPRVIPSNQKKKQQAQLRTESESQESTNAPDIEEELSSASAAFSERFGKGSKSLLHEGVLLIALVLGFFLVTWIRIEYENANRNR